MAALHLRVVSQERELVDTTVDSITVQSSEGELTILPDHVPLFTQLVAGELIYRHDDTQESLVVSQGFLTVAPNDSVIVMVDTATHEREISLQKAQEAVKNAEASVVSASTREELIMAEASLRRAMLEVKVAQKSKKTRI